MALCIALPQGEKEMRLVHVYSPHHAVWSPPSLPMWLGLLATGRGGYGACSDLLVTGRGRGVCSLRGGGVGLSRKKREVGGAMG
jgi:hypothetical protein